MNKIPYLYNAIFLKHNFNKNLFVFLKNYSNKPEVGILGLGKSKKKTGKLSATVEKKILPVETDPKILVTHLCGSNLLKEGEDIKLKPDSEYPDWLWDLNIGPPKPIEELDPNTKTYWRRLRRSGRRKDNEMLKLRKF